MKSSVNDMRPKFHLADLHNAFLSAYDIAGYCVCVEILIL